MRFLFITITLPLCLLSQNMVAASFDCNKAQKPIEQAICNDPKISQADEQMAAAYKTVIDTAKDGWKKEIVLNQRKWLKALSEEYESHHFENGQKEKLRDWLERALRGRIEQLKEIGEREKIVYLERTPETEDVCSRVLNKNRMGWVWQDNIEMEYFTLKIQPELEFNAWEFLPSSSVMKAKFDFFNNGVTSDVYWIQLDGSHIVYSWYIVLAPAEKDVIEPRLASADEYEKLAKDLMVEFPSGADKSYPFPVANPSTQKQLVKPKFATRLLDTSATELYGGWYTRSNVIRYKNMTYVVAESVNNITGPTFAVFKPQAPGSLHALCYFRATPSIVVKKINQIDAKYTCPTDLTPVKTDLDENCGMNSAQIKLKEWGGTRPVVVQRQEEDVGCVHLSMKVGELGQDKVEVNVWSPLNELKVVGTELFLTSAGPYISANKENVEHFYRIIDNTLKDTCSVELSRVSPPGYQLMQ